MKHIGARTSEAGFSIIELIVVAGVLVTLAGLLYPSLQGAINVAKRSRCQGNLRQIVTGVMCYVADHDGNFPLAAPHELGGRQGRVGAGSSWLPAQMFGGALPAKERPLNSYVDSPEVFRSPCDRGEPLWWFDTADYQKTSTCYELYGSSYFYASGYNRMGGVIAPMGLAKFVGTEFSYDKYTSDPLPLGKVLKITSYPQAANKVLIGSIPIYRTMSGVVALSQRARWYKNDPDHLWANAAFLDGHVEFVRVFPYDPGYQSVMTKPDETNPYY